MMIFWFLLSYSLMNSNSVVLSTVNRKNYNRRPRLPPFLLVESDGHGVQSSILPIFIPARAKALRACWAPKQLTLHSGHGWVNSWPSSIVTSSS